MMIRLLFDFTPKVAIFFISTCSMFRVYFPNSIISEQRRVRARRDRDDVLRPEADRRLEPRGGRLRRQGALWRTGYWLWHLFEASNKCNNNRLSLQGYLSVNRFGTFLGLAHAAMTAEGDNSVLMQKVAKERLGEISKAGFEIINDVNNTAGTYGHGL